MTCPLHCPYIVLPLLFTAIVRKSKKKNKKQLNYNKNRKRVHFLPDLVFNLGCYNINKLSSNGLCHENNVIGKHFQKPQGQKL